MPLSILHESANWLGRQQDGVREGAIGKSSFTEGLTSLARIFVPYQYSGLALSGSCHHFVTSLHNRALERVPRGSSGAGGGKLTAPSPCHCDQCAANRARLHIQPVSVVKCERAFPGPPCGEGGSLHLWNLQPNDISVTILHPRPRTIYWCAACEVAEFRNYEEELQ